MDRAQNELSQQRDIVADARNRGDVNGQAPRRVKKPEEDRTGKTPNQKATSQGTGKLESQQVCSLESALG